MNQGHMAPNERTRTVPHRAPQHKALTARRKGYNKTAD
jgi:hypothetical protein